MATGKTTIDTGDNFAFTCMATGNVNFTILIDNSTSTNKYDRLFMGEMKNGSQMFIFTDTSYHDDRTTFQCTVSIQQQTSVSNISTISVLCKSCDLKSCVTEIV